jgi:hypothetical protein
VQIDFVELRLKPPGEEEVKKKQLGTELQKVCP